LERTKHIGSVARKRAWANAVPRKREKPDGGDTVSNGKLFCRLHAQRGLPKGASEKTASQAPRISYLVFLGARKNK
jgi:hypothetical protein